MIRTLEQVDDLPMYVRLLLAVRVKYGWSQAQLAAALMVSRWTILRWENSHQEPPVMVQAALRELLAA